MIVTAIEWPLANKSPGSVLLLIFGAIIEQLLFPKKNARAAYYGLMGRVARIY